MAKPSLAPTATWLYDLVLALFAPLLDLFFREVQVRGAWRVPTKGAVLLVAAPHSNQFVDSLVLMRAMRSLNHRVSWLMAEKSFDKPIIGSLATFIGAVPVARAMDNTKPGEGKVYLDEKNTNVLLGLKTNFSDGRFQVGGSIYLPSMNGESHKLDIAEVRGPQEILLKTSPTSKDALDQLSRPNGIGFKVAPHVDQAAVYNAVFERLSKAGCIGIFPEGGSHDRPDLLPLKAGISIIALGALAQGIDLTVVPVGLNYFHAHKFRSRAVVEFGDPVAVPPETVESFTNGKKRESIGSVLDSMYQALSAVTVTAPDFETMMLVHTARRLYCSDKRPVPLPAVIEINRRLVKGYTAYETDPRVQKARSLVKEYSQGLQNLGLRDHQVEYAKFSVFWILFSLLYRLGKLSIFAIGTLPGLILFLPVFITARVYSHKKTREALAASTVKIRGNDVMATWKILVAGVLAPLLYTFYTIIIALWTHYNRINNHIPTSIPISSIILASYVIFPTITYAALRLGEIGMDILKSLRPLILCLFSSSAITDLREQRVQTLQQVTELINTLGPDLFPDCDAARLPQPRKLYVEVSPEASLDDLADTEFFSMPQLIP